MPDHARIPVTVPVAGTAQRPRWPELPAEVRRAVESLLDGRVEGAESQNSGFTPGFASRLWLADGRTVFAKAVSDENPWLLEAYRTEAGKLAVLPAAVPAPRSQGTLTVPTGDSTWFVLLFDDVDGAPPARPWGLDEARRVLRAAVLTAAALTPAPPGWTWAPIAAELDPVPDWSHARRRYLIGAAAQDLSLQGLPLLVGSTLTHSDLRDDNVIMGRDGRVWFCDWNFPTLGPAWLDAVTLAISMRGDGLDADALLEESGAVATGEDLVDVFLATLLGYFARAAQEPPPGNSPHLRRHQAWYGDVVADWLTCRRGW
jgi:Ser/Thr protein kinase RdoA (MazF antagonist)